MDPVNAMAALLVVSGIAGTAAGEAKNYPPSIFPPIDGPIVLPASAQGFVQGRGDEFLRPLSGAEQHIWDGLDESQRVRAALFINNGGTLISSFGSDF